MDLVKMGENQLISSKVPNPKKDAEDLYMGMLGIDRTRFFMDWSREVDDSQCEKYFALIEKRAKRMPLQYIIGYQEFMGLKIEVNPSVLIPRPETELLVEQAVKIMLSKGQQPSPLADGEEFSDKIASRKNWKVLDLCCGSGAIGIAVAHRCSNAKVTACDISSAAIETAKKNAQNARVKITFEQGDLFEAIGKKDYDMILSNPPYVKTVVLPTLQEEVKDYEPLLALDGGQDGLEFYRRIIAQAPVHLKRQGVLILETGHDQGEDIKAFVRANGSFEDCAVMKDYNGHDRIVVATMK